MTSKIFQAVFLSVLLVCTSQAGQGDKTILLVVNNGPNGWPDCGLREQLVSSLCDRNGLVLSAPERSEDLLQRLAGQFDKDKVLAEGQAEKCRYVLWCDVIKQKVTVENGFSLPMLITQKHVRASLELEYHIIDCSRGRSVGTDRIVVHKDGPATLQCVDITDADPKLMLSYTDKKDLFNRVENEAAKKLLAAFDEIARQR